LNLSANPTPVFQTADRHMSAVGY